MSNEFDDATMREFAVQFVMGVHRHAFGEHQ